MLINKLLPIAAALTCLTAHAGGDSLTITVTGLRNDSGQVGCTLHNSRDAFPTHPDKAVANQFVRISNHTATCVFDQVSAGNTYAVAVFHDENGNGKLDTGFLGIPKEGTGATRDARGHMGPPKFDDAAFRFAGGAVTMPVTIHY